MSEISVSGSDGVARLQLNRPAVFNALSPGLLRELIDRCAEIAADASVRAVVFDGAGNNFCAGADLPKFMQEMESEPQETADLGRRATAALSALPQITIAAIHGYCIGGAIVLSAACDMRLAADDSRFSIPELDAGIPLSWGGMHHVVRLVGESLANDLVLSCRPFSAEDALRAGLVSRVIPADSMANEVTALAEAVARKPRIVLAQTKRKLQAIRDGSFDARDDAAEMIAAVQDSEAREISAAYISKNIGK